METNSPLFIIRDKFLIISYNFPLFLYEGDSEDELAKICWKYANSIEAAIEEKGLYIAI